MDKRIIPATIPLSPSQINEYCQANCDGDNNIIYEFDVSDCPLKPSHIFGYLSNLKIDFRVVGYDTDFFEEYLRTPFLVGESNLIEDHKNFLLDQSVPLSILEQQLAVLLSLPLFLVESSNVDGPTKNQYVGEDHRDTDERLEYVGVNFVHLIKDPELLLTVIGDRVYSFDDQRYYTYYFDEYIYGGDKLIQFFIDNPNNLLNVAIESLLTR